MVKNAQTASFTETWSPRRREAQNVRSDGLRNVRTLASSSSALAVAMTDSEALLQEHVGTDAMSDILLHLLDELDEANIDHLLAVFGPGPAPVSSVTLRPWSSLLSPATVERLPELDECDVALPSSAPGPRRSRSGSSGVEIRVDVDADVSDSLHRPLVHTREWPSLAISSPAEHAHAAGKSPMPSLVKCRIVSVEEDDALFDTTRPLRCADAVPSEAFYATLVSSGAAPPSPSSLSSVAVVGEPLAFEEVRARSALEQQEFNLRCALTRFERGERGVWLYMERAI